MLDKLKLIASITPGDTLTVSIMKVQKHLSHEAVLSRRIFSSGENRWNTYKFVEETVLEALNLYQDNPDKILLDHIVLAIDGAKILRKTYNEPNLFYNLEYEINLEHNDSIIVENLDLLEHKSNDYVSIDIEECNV